MVGPIYNPNITNPGGTEESLAGSSSIITTGMDRVMNKNKINSASAEKKVDLKELEQYVQKLTDSTKVEKVKGQKERKEGSGQEENSLLQKRGKVKKEKEKKRRQAFSWIGSSSEEMYVLKAGSMDKFKRSTSATDQNLIKEYAVKYARALVGIPEELQEAIRIRLEEIEKELFSKGISEKVLAEFQAKIREAILNELSALIKRALFKSLSSTDDLVKIILLVKRAKLFNLAFFNEVIGKLNFGKGFETDKKMGFQDGILIEALLKEIKLDGIETKDLVSEAKNLSIDLKSWINLWNFEKVRINEHGDILIDLALLETESEKGMLLDELRMLLTQKHLDESLKNRIFFGLRIRKVLSALYEYGVSGAEIEEVRFQAKRLAWAKVVATLKDIHLKRVFSGTKREFSYYSGLIAIYTLKARKIGVGISHEGVKWIETKLKTLALESAEYKLHLLRSMQSITFDKKREKDIRWLTETYEHLKDQVHREETVFSLFGWLGHLLGIKAS
ncbi:MAG: hypothetical protein NT030_06630 [Candidatus Saganbacteria bacterium]|nr:hypothetical protein [Candidatus Saganbacteria bacterium]